MPHSALDRPRGATLGIINRLRAFAQIAHGALLFGVCLFVIASIVNLVERDDSPVWAQIVPALIFSLLASLFWYAAASWRSRTRAE